MNKRPTKRWAFSISAVEPTNVERKRMKWKRNRNAVSVFYSMTLAVKGITAGNPVERGRNAVSVFYSMTLAVKGITVICTSHCKPSAKSGLIRDKTTISY
jgi:hypothetical protein